MKASLDQKHAAERALMLLEPRDWPSNLLPLPSRILNALRNDDLATFGEVADLLNANPKAFAQVPNFGRKSLAEIIDLMKQHGLYVAKQERLPPSHLPPSEWPLSEVPISDRLIRILLRRNFLTLGDVNAALPELKRMRIIIPLSTKQLDELETFLQQYYF